MALNRSSQLEKAFALRANQRRLRVRSIRTSGMSVEGKLRGADMAMAVKQTIDSLSIEPVCND